MQKKFKKILDTQDQIYHFITIYISHTQFLTYYSLEWREHETFIFHISLTLCKIIKKEIIKGYTNKPNTLISHFNFYLNS